VARFWKTTPMMLAAMPEIEFRRMREFAIRSIDAENAAIDAENAAIEAAKRGAATPGRGPKPGDTIVDRKRGKPSIDDGF